MIFQEASRLQNIRNFFARIGNVKSIRGGKKIIEINLEYCLFHLNKKAF